MLGNQEIISSNACGRPKKPECPYLQGFTSHIFLEPFYLAQAGMPPASRPAQQEDENAVQALLSSHGPDSHAVLHRCHRR
ncbi:MAG: hypothetical protein MK089_05760, partial [Phycisphaerales bacterium]|nr:hypothetical protein [Phycisphaerales bacterium]